MTSNVIRDGFWEEDLNRRIQVRQCKQHGWYRNWQIRQYVAGTSARVFVYFNFRAAMYNAHRLSRGQMISTYGLRGFHIERRETHFDFH